MLRWLIWSIATAFCRHDWEREENIHEVIDWQYVVVGRKTMVSATCTKCGWHRSYKKF